MWGYHWVKDYLKQVGTVPLLITNLKIQVLFVKIFFLTRIRRLLQYLWWPVCFSDNRIASDTCNNRRRVTKRNQFQIEGTLGFEPEESERINTYEWF